MIGGFYSWWQVVDNEMIVEASSNYLYLAASSFLRTMVSGPRAENELDRNETRHWTAVLFLRSGWEPADS